MAGNFTVGMRRRTGTTALNQMKNITFGNSGYDVQALLFINFILSIGGTFTDVQRGAINTLVLDLKGIGPNNSTVDFWTSKITRFYPFVGGTALMHAIDLRNPGQNGIEFYNSITHDSVGVNFSGSNFALPGVNGTSDIPQNSCHFGIYFHSDVVGYNYGSIVGGSRTHINPSFYCLNDNEIGTNSLTSSVKGHHVISRTSSTAKAAYRNGAANGTSTASSVTPGESVLYCGGINLFGQFALGNANVWCCFHIGTGLSSGDASTLYTLVQAYQTSLSRNI